MCPLSSAHIKALLFRTAAHARSSVNALYRKPSFSPVGNSPCYTAMISRCPHPDLTACPLSFPCAYRYAPFLSSAANLYIIASFAAFPAVPFNFHRSSPAFTPVFCRYCFSGYRSSGRYRFYPQVQLSFCCTAIPGPLHRFLLLKSVFCAPGCLFLPQLFRSPAGKITR